MSLNYERIKEKEENGHTNWWTSYADLFMMLSVVFLLMYVSASLRSGTAGYLKQQEFKKIAQENSDLKEQIKVYNALKDQQLQQQSANEQEVYNKLLDKLSLLRDQTKNEKENLQKEAKENEDKEFALNQYQQTIRNIINANILAKAQIQHRDQTITQDKTVITAQDQDIHQKQQLLAENEAQITQVNDKLQKKISQLKREQKYAHITRKEAEKRIAALKSQSAVQIQALNERKVQTETELNQVRGNLAATEGKLGEAKQTIAQQEQEKSTLSQQLESTRQGYLNQISGLRAKHSAQLKAERDAFQADLERQNIGAAAKSKKLAQFAEQAGEKAKALEGQLAGLNGKVRDTEAKLAGAEQEKGRYVAAVEGLKKQNGALQSDLGKARALANARREIANSIGGAFKKAGVKANVDGSTGDVTLDFGEEYFDTGRADLKPGMRKKIDEFFPIYTDSLFKNPKTADKIASVEIIGFASSTFQGRYVNPQSLKPQDQEAVSYNLKLSFSRAKEIFKHIYGKNSLTDAQKKELLSVIKVTGRGYLPEGKTSSDIPDGLSDVEFCKRYNCNKAQKVIVKFNLKD